MEDEAVFRYFFFATVYMKAVSEEIPYELIETSGIFHAVKEYYISHNGYSFL